MDHNVFDIRKPLFNAFVNTFGYVMGFPKRLIAVHGYLQININFIAEHPGTEHIYSKYALLRQYIFRQFFSHSPFCRTYPAF